MQTKRAWFRKLAVAPIKVAPCLYMLVAVITSATFVPAEAQTFFPIVQDYECAQFPNGEEFLTKRTSTGFQLVKAAEVKEKYKAERRILTQRTKLLNELLSGYQKSRVALGKLIKGANKILSKIFGDDPIPSEIPPGEAEVRVFALKQRLLNRDLELKSLGELLDGCGKGLTVKKGRGTPIGVSIVPVSAASSNSIYGGFIIYSSKIKNQFSRTPTGYNVCLKLIFADGAASSFYTGFGDDNLCFSGSGKFEGVPQSVCNGFVPPGQAGFLIQKRQYAFTSLPDATTDQLLERMRLEVLQDQPIVGVLVLPVTLSRDASLKACEAF